jgi:hypothetical protein
VQQIPQRLAACGFRKPASAKSMASSSSVTTCNASRKTPAHRALGRRPFDTARWRPAVRATDLSG